MSPKKAPSAVKSVLLVLVAADKDKEYLGKGKKQGKEPSYPIGQPSPRELLLTHSSG